MKTNLLLIHLTAVTGLLLAACSKPAAAPIDPEGTVPAGRQPGQLTGLAGCEYQPQGGQVKYLAECGTLTDSENWDKPGARLIALPVVRIKASGSNPAEPVFWLMGGPGGPNLVWAPPAWLLAKHDVVMVGYRGVEGSVNLSCPELGCLMKAHTGKDLFSEQARGQYQASAKKCAAGIQAAGIDLTGYTIPAVIQDMEAARVALGYNKIDLFSESYGTRIAQIYAYMHPDSLHRVVQIGVNTPGHFLYSPSAIDEQIRYLSTLCAKDVSCSSRTIDLAGTMYRVNHNMPTHWLFLPIDPDTVRLGTQFLLFSKKDITTIADVYLAAGEGDPSGLAMTNLIMTFAMPSDTMVLGDTFSKGGTADLPKYGGIDSLSLGNSIMGAPLSELVWPTAAEWPMEPIPEKLRELQESDVDMLLINGTVDFSTPPSDLAEAKPYWHKAQMVLLPEFSHVGDEYTYQQGAFERLITSYYDTGAADSSLYVYEPLSFKPGMSMTTLAKLLVAAVIVVPAFVLLGVALAVRHKRRGMEPARAKTI